MKIKKYQNGGKNPPEVQANPSLAPDYRGVEPSLYDLGYEGPATMRPDLLFDAVGLPGLIKTLPSLARGAYSVLKNPKATYDALRGLVAGKSSVAPEIDMARREMLEGFAERSADKRALMNLQQKQLNDRLQNIADRAIREASKDESLAINELQIKLENLLRGEIQDFDKLQASLDDILRDIGFTEYLDNKSYQQLVKDIDQVLNEARGGSVSSTPLKDVTFDPRKTEPVEFFMEQATQPSFKLNKYGGKIKVLKK